MNKIEFIEAKLGRAELLAQLAEEATELAHAALKLRRVYDGTNPTPKTVDEALDGIKEEIADVQLLLVLLDLYGYSQGADCTKTMARKLNRWMARISAEEAKRC